MKLVVRPAGTDLFYQVSFAEPMFDLLRDEPRRSLVRDLVKSFDLSLNSIRFNRETPSNDFIHFTKFEGSNGWFEVSYGLETVTAQFKNPLKEERVSDLYAKLARCFEQYPVRSQRMNIQQQLSTAGELDSFLESLNPSVPTGFESALDGRGAFYTLTFPDQNLKIHISLVSSLFLAKGLFLSIENDFSPNLYKFEETFEIVGKHRDFILGELDLEIEMELEARNDT